MTAIQVNGIRLEYELRGPENGTPMLLIIGLACQLTLWPEPFLQALSEAGFRLVLVDNRDVGLSQKMKGSPNFPKILLQRLLLGRGKAPYSLEDMAADSMGLMDALGFDRFYIVAASMGAMIGQICAIQHPHRILGLVSMMSNTGKIFTRQPRMSLVYHLLKSKPKRPDRDGHIEHLMSIWRCLGSSDYPMNEVRLREAMAQQVDRSTDRGGVLRQAAAIIAAGSRVADLKKLRVPTLVIHGSKDPLIPLSGGRETARCIPNAEFHIIPGMGHELPEPLQLPISDLILNFINQRNPVVADSDG